MSTPKILLFPYILAFFTPVASRNKVHSEDEKESLPLALHHSPLTVTSGIFKNLSQPASAAADEPAALSHSSSSNTLSLLDPSKQEEADMDGRIIFSINAQVESMVFGSSSFSRIFFIPDLSLSLSYVFSSLILRSE